MSGYVLATDKRGARVKASNASGVKLYAHYNSDVALETNHLQAARALCIRHHWCGAYFGGGLDGRGYAFVCAGVPAPYHGAAFRVSAGDCSQPWD
jgi:hypothetical protein